MTAHKCVVFAAVMAVELFRPAGSSASKFYFFRCVCVAKQKRGMEEAPGLPDAAGVVLVFSGPRYLLLQNKRTGEWAPSKGHLHNDDGHCKADGLAVAGALRELREETGVELAPERLENGFLHTVEYRLPRPTRKVISGVKRTWYYLARVNASDLTWGVVLLSEEHTAARWPCLEEAVALAKYDEMESLLRSAHAFVCSPACLPALACGLPSTGAAQEPEPLWELAFTKKNALLVALRNEQQGAWTPLHALPPLLRLLTPGYTTLGDAAFLAQRCTPLLTKAGGGLFEARGAGADAACRLTASGLAAAARVVASLGPRAAAAVAVAVAARARALANTAMGAACVEAKTKAKACPGIS